MTKTQFIIWSVGSDESAARNSLSQAAATNVDPTCRKAFSKVHGFGLRRTQGGQCFHSNTIHLKASMLSATEFFCD